MWSDCWHTHTYQYYIKNYLISELFAHFMSGVSLFTYKTEQLYLKITQSDDSMQVFEMTANNRKSTSKQFHSLYGITAYYDGYVVSPWSEQCILVSCVRSPLLISCPIVEGHSVGWSAMLAPVAERGGGRAEGMKWEERNMRRRVGERLLSSTPPLYTFCSSGVHGLATSATSGREQDTEQEEVKE